MNLTACLKSVCKISGFVAYMYTTEGEKDTVSDETAPGTKLKLHYSTSVHLHGFPV